MPKAKVVSIRSPPYKAFPQVKQEEPDEQPAGGDAELLEGGSAKKVKTTYRARKSFQFKPPPPKVEILSDDEQREIAKEELIEKAKKEVKSEESEKEEFGAVVEFNEAEDQRLRQEQDALTPAEQADYEAKLESLLAEDLDAE